MMMPSIFGENLFDEMMRTFDDDFFTRPYRTAKTSTNLLKTDVKETDSTYELDIELPGFKKENISAKLDDGYLTIEAATDTNNDEKDDNGKYIRKERYSGRCSRSFYVGKNVKQEDIQAKFEDGILKLSIPKKDQQVVETKKHIAIEG